MNSKVRGSLLGGAIGDALGYQIEFRRNIKDKEVTRFKDKGIISDDTQMTLFTANALLWRDTNNINMSYCEAIYLGYLDWLDTQSNKKGDRCISWIKELSELNVPRAPGNTCLTSLLSNKMGTIDKPINDSKGCGTVMRVAPIGLYLHDSFEAGKLASESSAITHGHPLGIIPSYVLASMINLIVYKNLNIIDALNESINEMLKRYNIFNKRDTSYFIDLMNLAVKLSKSDLSDPEAIKELGEGWVSEEALAIAVYSCLKHQDSFEDTVVCAINHDGDSDSTGAVAGNIIGAYLGVESIPNYYLDNLELKDVICEMADDLVSKDTNNEYYKSKYKYSHKDITKI